MRAAFLSSSEPRVYFRTAAISRGHGTGPEHLPEERVRGAILFARTRSDAAVPWWLIVVAAIGAFLLIRWGLHLVGGLLGVAVLILIVLVLIGAVRVPI